jgi:hypothetical protein
VKAAEPQPGEGERIEMRCPDFAAERAQVGKAEVVGDDDQKVRAPGGDGVD